jgi:hypothetical protein
METSPHRSFSPRGCRIADLADAGLEPNPLEPRQSKGERNILTRGRDFAPAARDSASAPDSPARATPPLALEKGMFSAASNSRWTHSLLPSLLLSRFPLLGFQYTAAADDGIGSWRFGWRETVATPRPEVRIYSSHFPSPPLVLLEHASMTVGCLNLLVRCRVPRSCATFFFNKIWILFS